MSDVLSQPSLRKSSLFETMETKPCQDDILEIDSISSTSTLSVDSQASTLVNSTTDLQWLTLTNSRDEESRYLSEDDLKSDCKEWADRALGAGDRNTVLNSSSPAFTKRRKLLILFMTAFGAAFCPMASDMYFPALLPLGRDMKVSNGGMNLSLTTYMVSILSYSFRKANTSNDVSDI